MASNPNYHDLRPEVRAMAADVRKHSRINAADYVKYDVKRGLRDLNGKGVVAGLTEISEIHAKDQLPEGTEVPCEGKLYFRGIDVEELVSGALRQELFSYE